MKFDEDIRWKQRFQNFRRAFGLLRQALEDRDVESYSELEREGIIQRFEYTFELGWKTFKDYLEYSGVNIDEATPRKIIKECAVRGIFAAAEIDPQAYLNMMLERNALSHTYDFERFKQAILRIKSTHFEQLEAQYGFFMNKEIEYNEQHWPERK